ncbi:MAG: hypothetical protein QF773_11755, partial [Lentisphaeria bacterium]|nr:hypothetical protein [Lentisphaeria bacterium]
RTALDLQRRESAVVAKIPLTATTNAPVNLTVRRYDAGGIEILANGNGAVTLTVSDGDFVIAPARRYIVTVNGQSKTVDAADNLISTIDLNGLTSITITP